MKKRIFSLLLCVVLVITMLPIVNTTVHAYDPDYSFSIANKFYYPQSESDPESIPFSAFQEGLGDWSSDYCSPDTKNFTAVFMVFEIEIELPAYTKVGVTCNPKAYASSTNINLSGDFGLELFYFENDGEWNNLVFKTGDNDDRSSAASLGKDAANTFTKTEIALNPSQHYKEFDNSNGKATTGKFYYGILGYFRSTGFKHQMSLGWDFAGIAPYIDAKYIHYDANGGSGYADSVTTEQVSYVTLHSGEGFTKENSSFVGWYDGSTTYAPNGVYSKEEGAKLLAQYLTYDLNGGSGSVAAGVRGENGVPFASGEGISKKNSAFLGWGSSANGNITYAPGDIYSSTRSTTVYAQYLTYDLSDCSGTVTPGVWGDNGITIAGGDGLYKTGHTFVVWNTQKNGRGDSYAPGDTYSSRSGLTLYPIFEPNKYDLTLIQENAKVTVNQSPAVYGTQVDMVVTPSLGYRFENFEVYKTDDETVKVPLKGTNAFIQPEYPVTIRPILSKIPYAVDTYACENGSFTVSHETACIDDVVTVIATPEEGFELDAVTVTRTDNGEFLTVTNGSFVMVPCDVRVSVNFKNSFYSITKVPTINGSFTLNSDNAIQGETVVVNAVPDEGYQLKSITAYKTGDETVTIEVSGGSFVMPVFPVTVAVEFEPALLDIFKSSTIENGDITISHTEAQLGETVTVSTTAAKGYTLDAVTVYKTGDETVTVEVTDGSFVMPSYPVTVHAAFKKIGYTVSVEDASNEKGSFTVDKTTAQMGDAVTVSVTCAEGWAVRSITLTQSNGESMLVDEVFTMPASDVTVSVSYMVIPTYVITIPATVELGGEPMTVAITNAVMEEGVKLKVTLETDFTARTAEGAEKTFTINGGIVQNGDVVLMVEGGGTPSNPKQGSTQLSLDWDEIYQYSGNYRATLAFTIKVEDEGYNQTE